MFGKFDVNLSNKIFQLGTSAIMTGWFDLMQIFLIKYAQPHEVSKVFNI